MTIEKTYKLTIKDQAFFLSEEEVFSNCLTEFGSSSYNLIESVIYGED